MWRSRTKTDLIIEIWEKLDCESVGRSEIEAIEIAVEAQYGSSAVDPPMVLARLLADEGAELRHAEIMELHVKRASDRPYDAAFRDLVSLADLRSALASIRRMENLRRRYSADKDKQGIRLLLEAARRAKQEVEQDVLGPDGPARAEISQWFAVWLHTPELFEAWIDLRIVSPEFTRSFGLFE